MGVTSPPAMGEWERSRAWEKLLGLGAGSSAGEAHLPAGDIAHSHAG